MRSLSLASSIVLMAAALALAMPGPQIVKEKTVTPMPNVAGCCKR